MRYVRFNGGQIVEDRSVNGLDDLADILKKADMDDWLEGLGQPSCAYDLGMWHKMGEFISSLAEKANV